MGDYGFGYSEYAFDRNVIAYNGSARSLFLAGEVDITSFTCNDFFGNLGGNWVGNAQSYQGIDGNMTLDPLYCVGDGSAWTVDRDSPLLAPNNECTETIGVAVNGGPQCGGLGIPEPDPPVDNEPESSTHFRVHAGFPNPFRPVRGGSVNFAVEMPREEHLAVEVYDLRGARVATLRDAVLPVGLATIGWSGHDDRGGSVARGVYLVRFRTEDRLITRRVALLR